MTATDTISFGPLPDGRDTKLHTLDNGVLRVTVTDYGARLVSIEMPDKDQGRAHVLLGLDSARVYAEKGGSFGAVLGRYANRIAKGRFTLNGQTFELATNDQGNTLHGGPGGIGKQLWKTDQISGGAEPTLTLSYVSPDGEQGFPGALTVHAIFRLEGNTLWQTLEATTDRPTVINLSAHPYFNLAGVEKNDILSHKVTIRADHFLVVDDQQVPTGELRAVDGTVFDFREPRTIGQSVRDNDPQLMIGRGYDHCFALNDDTTLEPRSAIIVRDPTSGRTLEVLTTEPGLQLYSGNSLNGSLVGRGGVAYRQSSGLAIEAQNFPDAPNHDNFPSPILNPENLYRQVIGYRFS